MYNKLLFFNLLYGLLSASNVLFGMENPLAYTTLTTATFYIKNNEGLHLLNEHNQLEKLDDFKLPSLKYGSVALNPPSSETQGSYSLSTTEISELSNTPRNTIIATIKNLSDEQVVALRYGLEKKDGDKKILLAKVDNNYMHIK